MSKNVSQKPSIQELAKRAAPIARNARLLSIELSGIEAKRANGWPNEHPPVDVKVGQSIRHRFVPESDETPGRLFVDLTFKMKVRPDPEEDEPELASIACTFALTYQLNRGMPDDARDLLPAFAETNSVLHAWPYLREFVQSTTWRMGLPPLSLPLFQIGGPRERTSPAEPDPKKR